jgi:hypothetical protein
MSRDLQRRIVALERAYGAHADVIHKREQERQEAAELEAETDRRVALAEKRHADEGTVKSAYDRWVMRQQIRGVVVRDFERRRESPAKKRERERVMKDFRERAAAMWESAAEGHARSTAARTNDNGKSTS